MIRESKAIERRLRGRVRQIVRASPALWSEYKKARRASRQPPAVVAAMTLATVVGFPMVLVGCPLFLTWKCADTGGADFALAAAGWCSLLVSLWVAFMMQAILSGYAPRNRFLALLPVADDCIARRAMYLTVLFSVPWFAWVVGPFLFVAWHEGLAFNGWLVAVGFSAVQCMVTFATGLALPYLGPRSWYNRELGLAMAGTILLTLVPAAKSKLVANLLYLCTPGGWLAAAFGRGWLAGQTIGWLGLAPTALLIWLLFRIWNSLPRLYSPVEVSPQSNERRISAQSSAARAWLAWRSWLAWISGELGAEQTEDGDVGEVFRTIQSREFLQTRELFPQPWLSRLAKRFLTAEEHLIAECSGPDASTAAAGNRELVRLVLLAFVVGLSGWFTVSLTAIVACALAIGSMSQKVRGRHWPGLAVQPFDGIVAPYYLSMPIAYGTLTRIILKHWLLQVLPFFPALIIAAASDLQLKIIPAGNLLAAAVAIVCILVCHPLWSASAHLVLSAGMLVMPWSRCYYTVLAMVLGMVLLLSTEFMLLLFILPGLGAVPIGFVACCASLSFLSAYALLRLCVRAQCRGYCGTVAWRYPAGAVAMSRMSQSVSWRQQARGNREALRRRFGMFWWLPRYMMEARQEQGL